MIDPSIQNAISLLESKGYKIIEPLTPEKEKQIDDYLAKFQPLNQRSLNDLFERRQKSSGPW